MAYYGNNPDLNKYIEYATGVTGPFGQGGIAPQLTAKGLPTDQDYWRNQMQNDSTYGPNQTTPVAPPVDTSQITGNQGIMMGNQNTMLGNQGQMLGNQGTILGNQGVLQQDISGVGQAVGNVGQGVSQVGQAIGTPAEQGQTLFGNIGNLYNAQQGIMGNINTLTGNLGNFRDAFNTYSADANQQRGVMQTQGLNQRGDLLQEVQAMQPFLNRMDQALRANPMAFGPMGYNPAAYGATQPMTGTTTMAMAPQTTQAINTGLSSAVNTGQMQMGPMGVQAIDPRDMI